MKPAWKPWGLGFALFLLSVTSLGSSVWAQGIQSAAGGLQTSPTSADPMSQLWNPATIGLLKGTHIATNLSLIGGWMIFDRKGLDPNTGSPFASSETTGIAPNLYAAVVTDLGQEDLRFSYATYFPSGALADFNPQGSQRYDLISGYLIPWHHQFSFGFRPAENWSVAVSGILSLGFFQSELDVDLGKLMKTFLNAEDVPPEHPALASRARVPRTWSPGFGGAIGFVHQPQPRFSWGASLYTPVYYKFSGQLEVTTPEIGSLVGAALPALGIDQRFNSDVSVQTSLPAFIHVGAQYQAFPYWVQSYFGRYVFSSFQKSLHLKVERSPIQELNKLEVSGQSPQDSWMLGTIQALPLWKWLTPGFHVSFTRHATKDRFLSVSRVDFDTLTTGGFVHAQWDQSWQLGLEYSHSFAFERSTSETSRPTTSTYFTQPDSSGTYRAGFDRLGVSLRYAF
jgi:long-subunit fatty acid transport protein